MTTTIRSCMNDNYYITLKIERRHGNDIYVVQACPAIDAYECGCPEREMTYSIKDKKNAYATYRRYMKKYV